MRTAVGGLAEGAASAVLGTVLDLLGMEVAYLGAVDGDRLTFIRLRTAPGAPDWPGVAEGRSVPAADALCTVMLGNRQQASADVPNDPDYGPPAARLGLGIGSYAGVPILDEDGHTLATLAAIDRGRVAVSDAQLRLLSRFAAVVSTLFPEPGDISIRRTSHGWQVAGQKEDDLAAAMTLADLLAGDPPVPPRPPKVALENLDEPDRLRVVVDQLQHALASRVCIEQAIGVLSERQSIGTRAAFENLRSVARRSGRRVRDVASDVVRSAAEPNLPLPAPLRRPHPPGGRESVRPPGRGLGAPAQRTPAQVPRR